MKRFLVLFSVVMALILTVPAYTNAQCAMCRASVESNVQTQDSQIGAGLNSGILYLMSIPYILIGTVGFIWYRYSKNSKPKHQFNG